MNIDSTNYKWILAGICLLLLVGGALSHASPSATDATAPAAVVAPADAAAPPAPNPTISSDRYLKVVDIELNALVTGLQGITSSCANLADASCPVAYQGLGDVMQHFKDDLATTPAPDCLASADVELRQGVDLFIQTAKVGVQAVADADAGRSAGAEFRQSQALMTQAAQHEQRFNTLKQEAQC